MDSSNSSLRAIQLQNMWSRLIAVVGEQAQVLLRTAFSSIVRECGDLSAAIFDLKGRMLAQAVTGTPGHVNSMAESVGHFIEHFPLRGMKSGDAYITNDPWIATGHLNDFTVLTPAFHDGRLVALFACTSHIMDIGGSGLSPDSTDVFMEGLYVPFLRLMDQEVVNETLIAMMRANTRLPVDTVGDVYALAACNDVAVRSLSHMMREFSIEALDELASHIVKYSRDAVVNEVAKLPKGRWSYSITTDGYDGEPVVLKATVAIAGDRIDVDFAGTSKAIRRGINVPLAYAKAYTAFGIGCVIASNIPNNSGSLEPIHISAPENCILNAQKPAAVAARHILGQMLPDVVFGCLRQAIPERIPAEGTACIWDITVRGTSSHPGANGDGSYSLCITTNGGTGARPKQDGLSATAFPSGVQGTPVEIAELECPLIFLKKELRPDSGGKGATFGGLGQIIEVVNGDDAPFEFLAALDRIDHPPRGALGGTDGAPGVLALGSGVPLKGKGVHVIRAGEKLILMTPGGGGFGDPKDRPSHLAKNGS
jgi:N-methylhydantoinase B